MFPVSRLYCLKHQCLLFSTPELSVTLQVFPQPYTGRTLKCRKVSTLEEQFSVRSNHLPSGREESEHKCLGRATPQEKVLMCVPQGFSEEPGGGGSPKLVPSSLSTLFLLPGVAQVLTSGPAFGKTQTKMGIFCLHII